MLPDERAIYPQPRTVVERYMNNMHYLDRCLGDYVQSLGSGTTVMIYADHPTEEGDASFTPDRSGGREFVPCFIYDSDQDLSKLQKTRGRAIATSGELNLVDVINYLRAQVVRTFPPQLSRKDVSEAGN
jgi:phosphopentomutase